MAAAAAERSKVKEAGDPRFNISQVVPSQTIGRVTAVYSEEDAALDRELEKIARETEPALPIDPDISTKVVKTKDMPNFLSDIVEIKPASNINELMDQVHQAKEHDCDSIYATDALIRHYCRKAMPVDPGYFIFHDIKVYIIGHFDEAKTK